MTNQEIQSSDFFIAGGALPADCPSYVARLADDELFQAVEAGQFCYVLADHHMGKSSLMFRTVWRLEQQGIKTVTVDLSGIGTRTGLEQAYQILIKRLKFELKLSIAPDTWWNEQDTVNPADRFTDFLHDIALAEVKETIVIFVDGVDSSTLNTDFFANFSKTIQAVYNARPTESVYQRLTFVLLGMATLADLVNHKNQMLFENGHKIELYELSREEAQLLQHGLQTDHPESQEAVFDRILYWTNGHPYLTQRLCLSTAKMWNGHWTEDQVDTLVENLFLTAMGYEDPNLQFVEDSINADKRRDKLLSLYHRVCEGKNGTRDKKSLDQLKLMGLVGAENGTIRVRNEIYREAFDLNWIKANTPFKWKRTAGIISILLILLLAGVIAFTIQQQKQRATQAQTFTDNFRNAMSPEARLINLAGLFNLRGYESQARQLFYEELSPDDQLALINPTDPEAMDEQLVTVVRGIYTDATLENNEQSNDLLQAMAQSLSQLQYSPSLGSIELELEITQWLKGRENHHTEGQYQRAVDAYSIAINVNNQNPGVYFDRGLAYVELDRPDQALGDFATVLDLDGSWQPRIQQALVSDSQLYLVLWSEQSDHGTLIALVPTPTSTPTPTFTPTPSPTPMPTHTPLPPTATPTTTPSPTATATPSPTPTRIIDLIPTRTPTPSSPTGTVTLLNPNVSEDTASGVIDFEWQWQGTLPSEYGFEIRVWREGNIPTGVHNSVLDNQNGIIKNVGGDTYRLSVDIKDAAGVQGQSGTYFWTVALVQISPTYQDLGQQVEPISFRYAAPGRPGGGGGDGGGGSSGGVGVE